MMRLIAFMFVPMVFLLLMSFLCWRFSQSALWRGRWTGEKDEIIPDSAPRLALPWRALQAAIIAALGFCLLYFLGAAGDGPLGHLGEMRPAKAMIVGVATAATVLMILLGALLALAGGTGLGCWLTALALVVFGALNAGGSWTLIDQLCPGNSADPRTIYTIQVTDGIPGAEIWANNVLLGKTPLRITHDELMAKVPLLTSIPGVTSTTTIGTQRNQQIINPTWDECSIMEPRNTFRPEYWGRGGASQPNNQIKLYVRARLDGEWGRSTGMGSNGFGGRYTNHCEVFMGFNFPAREARVNALLAQAQAAAFKPTPDWFKALEALNPTAWRMLSGRATGDPKMQALRDAWVAWRYGLDQAATPGAAWRALDAITREAEERREFSTATPAGRAVALLAPRLDLERLVTEATRLLRTSTGWGVSFTSPLGEQTEFSSITNLGMIERQPPLRAYVLAQALRTAGVQSFKKTGHYPALFQTQLAPALVRFSSGNERALKIAAACGGPLVEKYLLRQPWSKPPDMRDFHNVSYVSGGGHVNKWLLLLVGMDNDIGRRFRATHRQEVLDLAQQIMQTAVPLLDRLDEFAFLFLDPQLALEFWPTYSAKVRAKGFEPLRDQWKYLVKMGAAATPEMFLETIRQEYARAENSKGIEPWDVYELKQLPPLRQAEILKAIQAYIESQIVERIKLHGKNDSRALELQYRDLLPIKEAQRRVRSQLATPAAGPQRPPTR